MNKQEKQAKWLSEILGKVAEGEELYLAHYIDHDMWFPETEIFPTMNSDPKRWKTVKPKPKIVDLSPLVNSGVLCEFWNKLPEGLRKRAFLKSTEGTAFSEGPFVDDHDTDWSHCRPLLNHWNVIEGDLSEGPMIEGIICNWDTCHGIGGVFHRVKYTGLQEGWEWP